MKLCTVSIVGAWAILLLTAASQAEIKTIVEQSGSASAAFQFQNVPAPSQNDAATQATFTLVDGRRDSNGGDLAKLHDGKVPTEDDQPAENFFFAADADGGRLLVDLGSAIDIKQVNTYSWHPAARGPQVYVLYAAVGNADGFDPQPKKGRDPQTCGWKQIAQVDTRSKQRADGGQYAAPPVQALHSQCHAFTVVAHLEQAVVIGDVDDHAVAIRVVQGGIASEAIVEERTGRLVGHVAHQSIRDCFGVHDSSSNGITN